MHIMFWNGTQQAFLRSEAGHDMNYDGSEDSLKKEQTRQSLPKVFLLLVIRTSKLELFVGPNMFLLVRKM